MSESKTADIALHSAQSPGMYALVYDAVKKSKDGLTTDQIAQQEDKPNHLISSRVAYLVLHGYLRFTSERRVTRNGYEAEVLVCTNKPVIDGKFDCPIRETQKNFLLRIIDSIKDGDLTGAIDACTERYNGLRR